MGRARSNERHVVYAWYAELSSFDEKRGKIADSTIVQPDGKFAVYQLAKPKRPCRVLHPVAQL